MNTQIRLGCVQPADPCSDSGFWTYQQGDSGKKYARKILTRGEGDIVSNGLCSWTFIRIRRNRLCFFGGGFFCGRLVAPPPLCLWGALVRLNLVAQL